VTTPEYYPEKGINLFIAGKAPDGNWRAVPMTPMPLTVTCRKRESWGACWKKDWET